MLPEYKTKTNVGIGLGILMQFAAQALPPGLLRLPVALIATALTIWGCCSYAKGKGYHWGWGFLGLLSLIGLIILVCFPDKHKNP